MLKFVHLADLHLVPTPRPLYALDPRDRLVLADADSLMVHTHFYMDDSPRFIMDHREAEEAATLADLAGARN